MRRSNAIRVIAFFGLLSAAFFAALPWLLCVSNVFVLGGTSPDDYLFWPRVCTVGFPVPPLPQPGLPGFNGPYWGYLILGIVYLIASVYVAVSKRF